MNSSQFFKTTSKFYLGFARERDKRHFPVSIVSMSYELSRTGLSRINMFRLACNKRIRDFILYIAKKAENRFLDIQTEDNRTVLPL